MATEVIIDAMPFDSREVTDPETGDVYYDRIHSAEDFAQWLSTFFGNGIVVAGSQAISSELRVTSSGLVATVEPGAIVINGRTGWVSTNLSLDISAGGQTGRWDRVVAELNIPNDRQISIKVVQGTNSAPPSLVRTGNVYQLSLAKLRIEAGSASAVVTDERSDLELCGPSNVLVGVQIPEAPTGDEAANIAISDALAQAYELTNPNKNVEKALDKLKNSISVVVSVNGRTGAVTVQEKITASGLLKGDGNGGVTPNGTVSVEQGGTGATTLASGGLLKGNGQGAVGTLSGVGALFASASGSPQFGILPVVLGGTGQNSVDGTPTQNSPKLITSGGVYNALANRIATFNGKTGDVTYNAGAIIHEVTQYINYSDPAENTNPTTFSLDLGTNGYAKHVLLGISYGNRSNGFYNFQKRLTNMDAPCQAAVIELIYKEGIGYIARVVSEVVDTNNKFLGTAESYLHGTSNLTDILTIADDEYDFGGSSIISLSTAEGFLDGTLGGYVSLGKISTDVNQRYVFFEIEKGVDVAITYQFTATALVIE